MMFFLALFIIIVLSPFVGITTLMAIFRVLLSLV